MSLHSLLSVTIGVPNVAQTAAYYADFGLTPGADGWFSTTDAGRQLRILPAPTRRLLALRVGADDADDLARAAEPDQARRVDARGTGRRPRPVRLGPAAAALLPASRGPRGHDDWSALGPLSRLAYGLSRGAPAGQ